MNEELFDKFEALTFDDLLIVPGYTEVLPDQTEVKARLARDLWLNVPLSAAMDTVTEARLAIALAREGGLGIIHRNMPPAQQAAEVEKVKRSESGMIVDPVTLPPTATLQDAEDLMGKFHISGVPIVDEQRRLVGILSNRDTRFAEPADFLKPVSEFMTTDPLITAPVGTTFDEAKRILHQHRIEKLPLVDEAGHLKGLDHRQRHSEEARLPQRATDSKGRLLVGAAVGLVKTSKSAWLAAGRRRRRCDHVDTAHGHSQGVMTAIQRIRSVARFCRSSRAMSSRRRRDGADRRGRDAIKIGVGAGSICTTRVISGAGMPQMTAIFECTRVRGNAIFPPSPTAASSTAAIS